MEAGRVQRENRVGFAQSTHAHIHRRLHRLIEKRRIVQEKISALRWHLATKTCLTFMGCCWIYPSRDCLLVLARARARACVLVFLSLTYAFCLRVSLCPSLTLCLFLSCHTLSGSVFPSLNPSLFFSFFHSPCVCMCVCVCWRACVCLSACACVRACVQQTKGARSKNLESIDSKALLEGPSQTSHPVVAPSPPIAAILNPRRAGEERHHIMTMQAAMLHL